MLHFENGEKRENVMPVEKKRKTHTHMYIHTYVYMFVDAN